MSVGEGLLAAIQASQAITQSQRDYYARNRQFELDREKLDLDRQRLGQVDRELSQQDTRLALTEREVVVAEGQFGRDQAKDAREQTQRSGQKTINMGLSNGSIDLSKPGSLVDVEDPMSIAGREFVLGVLNGALPVKEEAAKKGFGWTGVNAHVGEDGQTRYTVMGQYANGEPGVLTTAGEVTDVPGDSVVSVTREELNELLSVKTVSLMGTALGPDKLFEFLVKQGMPVPTATKLKEEAGKTSTVLNTVYSNLGIAAGRQLTASLAAAGSSEERKAIVVDVAKSMGIDTSIPSEPTADVAAADKTHYVGKIANSPAVRSLVFPATESQYESDRYAKQRPQSAMPGVGKNFGAYIDTQQEELARLNTEIGALENDYTASAAANESADTLQRLARDMDEKTGKANKLVKDTNNKILQEVEREIATLEKTIDSSNLGPNNSAYKDYAQKLEELQQTRDSIKDAGKPVTPMMSSDQYKALEEGIFSKLSNMPLDELQALSTTTGIDFTPDEQQVMAARLAELRIDNIADIPKLMPNKEVVAHLAMLSTMAQSDAERVLMTDAWNNYRDTGRTSFSEEELATFNLERQKEERLQQQFGLDFLKEQRQRLDSATAERRLNYEIAGGDEDIGEILEYAEKLNREVTQAFETTDPVTGEVRQAEGEEAIKAANRFIRTKLPYFRQQLESLTAQSPEYALRHRGRISALLNEMSRGISMATHAKTNKDKDASYDIADLFAYYTGWGGSKDPGPSTVDVSDLDLNNVHFGKESPAGVRNFVYRTTGGEPVGLPIPAREIENRNRALYAIMVTAAEQNKLKRAQSQTPQ